MRQGFQGVVTKPGTCWLPDQNQTLTSPSPFLHPKVDTTAAFPPSPGAPSNTFSPTKKTSDSKTSDLPPGWRKKRKRCR